MSVVFVCLDRTIIQNSVTSGQILKGYGLVVIPFLGVVNNSPLQSLIPCNISHKKSGFLEMSITSYIMLSDILQDRSFKSLQVKEMMEVFANLGWN